MEVLTREKIRETLGLRPETFSEPEDNFALGTSARPGHCIRCGEPVRTMVFRGSGYCSALCEHPRTNNKG